MKIFKKFVCAAIIILMSGCQEELFKDVKVVEEGIPVRVKIGVDIPISTSITRAIQTQETELSSLTLIFVSKYSNLRKVVSVPINPENNLEADYSIGSARYESEEIDMVTGTFYLYAIANTDSPFGETITDANLQELFGETANEVDNDHLNKIETMTTSQLDNLITELADKENLLMVGKQENVIIEHDETSLSLSLKRVTSHIEFIFTTRYQNVSFTPISYSVYNLPKLSYVYNSGSKKIYNEDKSHYSHYEDIKINTGDNGFDFLMFENINDTIAELQNYHSRDKWEVKSNAGTGNADKTFLYAPEKSTFVVVTGTYTDPEYTGTVSYTIHLGNMDKSGSMGNFTVGRNEYHKNRVTIIGVDDIINECTVTEDNQQYVDGGLQPGAEGDIIKKNNTTFLLDAHYETVMLELNLNDYDYSVDQKVSIRTPYQDITLDMGVDEDRYSDKKYDLEWIKFIKPTSPKDMVSYPGTNNSKLCNIYKLISELKHLNETGKESAFILRPDKSTSTVFVQAFIDEYYYDKLPSDDNVDADWRKFVNSGINRSMTVRSVPAVSSDGNSHFTKDLSFSIAQRSIKTVYSTERQINGFGIETWDETGLLPFNSGRVNNLDDEDGLLNTKALFSGYRSSDYILSKRGYFSRADVEISNRKYASNPVSNARYACLSRNRDEDGNGKIEGDEIKWYLPAVNQYLTLWIGENQLEDDTRLFDPDLVRSVTHEQSQGAGSNETNCHQMLHHLFTSSKDDFRIYWPIEGSAYGKNSSAGGTTQSNHYVRCIRNFGNNAGGIEPVTEFKDMVVTVKNINGHIRSYTRTEPYPLEQNNRRLNIERSDYNKLYKSFEVASENLSINNQSLFSLSQIKNIQLCDSYTQGTKKGWRVPNQRELMLMVRHKVGLTAPTASSTFFTNTYKQHPFFYNGNISLGECNSYYVRCVRDY